MDYNITWYLIVGFLLMGYAILDGFDLGVGALHLFTTKDLDRRILLNSIGPVWDGNEVWLITAGGALFAAFPEVYATAFSGFYIPFMLLLFSLIFRAVSIEFRSKEQSRIWRSSWDTCFSIGSILAAFLFGVAIGNIIIGFNIGSNKEYQGSFSDLVTPYTLLTGVFNLTMFSMHGAIYLYLKTEGDLQQHVKSWIIKIYSAFVILFIVTTLSTLFLRPEMIANFSFGAIKFPGETHRIITDYQNLISFVAWIVVIMNILSIANIPRALAKNNPFQMFISSSCTIAALIMLFALGIFPNMMISKMSPEYNLDIYNAASTTYTLKKMMIFAIFGFPFVAAYTTAIYWTYRGKTRIEESSY
jgi:cytochrome bd ubiquinol oxidase subunit II